MSNRIACFGEVLFDVFPSHRCIGGAPLNVSFRLKSFGNQVDLISKIGEDSLGSEILQFLNQHQLSSKNIQIDSRHQTSEVKVTFDKNGNASYEIVKPCAWDFIEVNKHALNSVKKADAFIFGSLSSRHKGSNRTLLQLLAVSTFNIFDVNLRVPHYTIKLLQELMNFAHFIKFNDEEILLICKALGKKTTNLKKATKFISDTTNTPIICVTKGANGALLLMNDSFYNHNGYKVKVANTVGAGDSFLAGLTHQLLTKKHPEQALDFACKIGSEVAKNKGANPLINI